MSKSVFFIATIFLMLSCQDQTSEPNVRMGKYTPHDALAIDEETEIEPPRTAEPPSPPDYNPMSGSKIIKNGHMMFEVSKLELAKSKVDKILRKCSGYYEKEQYKSHGNRNSYSLQLRIPSSKFDTLISVIQDGVGELKSKSISAKDVTKEYVDLNIRLENNLAYLAQYKEILKRTKSVKEILEVKEKIRRIEEEIESKKGRLKFLDDKVKYSTLKLELSELTTSDFYKKPNFGRRLVNAFNNGFEGSISFIIGLITLWPLVILLVILFVGRRRIINKLNWRKRNTPPNSKG